VLDLSLRDPLSLGHDRIGTEQILLGACSRELGVRTWNLYDPMPRRGRSLGGTKRVSRRLILDPSGSLSVWS
jgi:hypothetical protein